jgi:FKBP-type peptidyl-prolyl cis-trans isomerase
MNFARRNSNLIKNQFANRLRNLQNALSFNTMKRIGFALIFLAGAALLNGCKPTSASDSDQTTNTTATTASSVNSTATTNTSATASSASGTNILSTDKERQSYAVGMYMAHGWMTHNVDLDPDMVLRGIKDQENTNGTTLMNEQEMANNLRELQAVVRASGEKMQREAMMKAQLDSQKNLMSGDAFLAANKTKPGVVTLDDGLQYKIIKDGTGPVPGPNDIVRVNYRGTFIDGKEFDSSAKAGHPIEFPVHSVIPGWTEGLEKMKVGSKWELYIPSKLAYGPSGRMPVIEPNSTLVFEVELLDVHAAPPPPPPPAPLTSDIIKVPSAEEMKKGAQIETIKASDLQKIQSSTNNSTNQ